MENKSHALITGIFTLSLLIAAIWGGMWFNRDRAERIPYLLATQQAISGLNPQAPVRYRGLMVGRVKKISFDPKLPGQILVEIGVNPDTPMTASTFASLGYQGVTGLAFVQLDDDGSRPQALHSNAENMARIPLRQGMLQRLEQNAQKILQQSEELTRNANLLLAASNQQRLFSAIDGFGRAAEKFQLLPEQLQPTLANLPAVTQAAEKSLHAVNLLSNDVSQLAKNLNHLTTRLHAADSPVYKIGKTADHATTLANEIELETLPRIHALSEDARGSMRVLNQSLQQFNERPQAILFGSMAAPPGPGERGFVAPPSAQP